MSRANEPGEIILSQETYNAYEKTFTKKEYATPVADRVLVKVKNKEIKTPSGLLVAQTNPTLPIDGIVVAIGDSPKILCRVGDRIVFHKYAGVEVKLNNEDHIVLAANEVLGLLE